MAHGLDDEASGFCALYTMGYEVLCAGILVADVFIPVISQLPTAGQLVATADFLIETGGCAANVANGLAKLGVSPAVVGKVGDDLFGDFIVTQLANNRIGTDNITRTPDYGTSKTIILTVEGEDRRYIHTFGANAAFHSDDIDKDVVTAAKLFYVGGFFVLPQLDTSHLAALFAHARQHHTRTLLDVVVPAGSKTVDMDSFAHLLQQTDFFMPNLEEARMLTGQQDPQEQANIFLDAGCGAVMITMGDKGLLYQDADQTIIVPPYHIDFVDGSGAGDAFAAGLMVGLLEDWPIQQTLQFASAIGASACTALGCTTGLFTRDEAAAFVASQHS
ncbi:MAG: carbohydrate kinase family protein [Chloroflexi bacterium]|nr:MAG: carbohydrate kinase family protein [Chloroflexota bacterium]